MDFIIEFFGELFFEILGAVIESDRVPKSIRYILLGVIAAPLLALVGYGIYAADLLWKVVLAVIAIVLVALFVYLICSIHRSVVLKPANKEDLLQILKLYRSVIGRPGCTWNVFYPSEATLYEDFNAGNLYTLRRGKTLIGAGSIVPENELDDLDFWTCKENAQEIARIVIHPDHQGKKYGTHLVKKLCKQLENRGCQAVHLLVSTGSDSARKLYDGVGFHIKGICSRYAHEYYACEKKL